MAYPNRVPLEVQQAVDAHEKQMAKETANSPLACIPGLQKDRVRQHFIIKTYSIIMTMLAFTSGVTALFYTTEPLRKFAA